MEGRRAIMSRSGTLDRTASALLLLFAFLILLKIGGADYVETAPRPGAPLPPAIPPGECPLTFSPADIQEAKQVCSSGRFASIDIC